MKGVKKEKKEEWKFKLLMLIEAKKCFPNDKEAAVSWGSKLASRGERRRHDLINNIQ